MSNIKTTPDCCSQWPIIRRKLKLFASKDAPEIVTMYGLASYRVNYCPSCGVSKRETIWNTITDPPSHSVEILTY